MERVTRYAFTDSGRGRGGKKRLTTSASAKERLTGRKRPLESSRRARFSSLHEYSDDMPLHQAEDQDAANQRNAIRMRQKCNLAGEAVVRRLPKLMNKENGLRDVIGLLETAKGHFEHAGNTEKLDDMLALRERAQGDQLRERANAALRSLEYDEHVKHLQQARIHYRNYTKSAYHVRLDNLVEKRSKSGYVPQEKNPKKESKGEKTDEENITVEEEFALDQQRKRDVEHIYSKTKRLARLDGERLMVEADSRLGDYDWEGAKRKYSEADTSFKWAGVQVNQII
jgi:hypothetical protein